MDKDELAALDRAATQGVWRVGADLIRIHPYTGDNATDYHRNGFAKTIAAIGKEDGDWRHITQQVSDAKLIGALVNLYRANQLVLIGPDAVERLIDAIDDAGHGYSINLVRLVDGEATYNLTYRGETTQHPSHSDALEALRELARQEKIAAALAALGVK